MWGSADRNKIYVSKSDAAAFLAHFWPVRVRARARVRARVRGWVFGSKPVPLSDQEVFSAREREQPTAPKIRAASLLGERGPSRVLLL